MNEFTLISLIIVELSENELEETNAGFAIGWAIATHLCDCPGHNN